MRIAYLEHILAKNVINVYMKNILLLLPIHGRKHMDGNLCNNSAKLRKPFYFVKNDTCEWLGTYLKEKKNCK